MVTLAEYRKLEDKFNKKVELLKEFMRGEKSECKPIPLVTTQEEFYAHRDLMAEKIKTATQMVMEEITLRKSISQLGNTSSYVDVLCKCSMCGETCKLLENQYADFDFRTALCEECKSKNINKDTADIIRKAENVQGVFDTEGELIEITFESDGIPFNIFNERKDGYRNTLTLERE